MRSGLELRPLITGGSQERGLRGGTLPTAPIVGFGVACELAEENLDEDHARISALTSRLYDRLHEEHPSLHLFGHSESRVTGSLNIGFPGVPADLAIRNLADEIAVSSGSACASATSEPSRVLMALGLDPDTAATGIRISLGRFTTEEDVETAIAALSKIRSLASQT